VQISGASVEDPFKTARGGMLGGGHDKLNFRVILFNARKGAAIAALSW